MGCSDSKNKDPYDIMLKKNEIEQVREFIVSSSKIDFIESSQNQILNVLQQKINVLKASLINEVESAKIEIDKKYQKSLQRIQQSNPRAISKAEKIFKGKIDQLMGYRDAVKRINEYKQQCRVGFQRQQNHTMSYLNNFFKKLLDQQRQNIPQLKKYDQLNEEDQERFLKIGKQKNKSSVEKGLGEVEKVIEDKCHISNFEPKFQSIVSRQKLMSYIREAQKSFLNAEQRINSASDCQTC